MDAALKKTKLDWNPIKIEEIAQHCNDRKLAAKAVSGICKHIFFAKSQCPISIIRHLTSFFFLNFLGKDVCMGDHKPVFLRCHLKLTQTSSNLSGSASDTRCPRVESPSYTDLLSSPPVSNGGCLRFTDIKDPATVKLFKETTV